MANLSNSFYKTDGTLDADTELRRQKAAYRQNVIRIAVIGGAACILAGIGLYWYYYIHTQAHYGNGVKQDNFFLPVKNRFPEFIGRTKNTVISALI